jgi:hypothetical protein
MLREIRSRWLRPAAAEAPITSPADMKPMAARSVVTSNRRKRAGMLRASRARE